MAWYADMQEDDTPDCMTLKQRIQITDDDFIRNMEIFDQLIQMKKQQQQACPEEMSEKDLNLMKKIIFSDSCCDPFHRITLSEFRRFKKMFNHITQLYGNVDLEQFRYEFLQPDASHQSSTLCPTNSCMSE